MPTVFSHAVAAAATGVAFSPKAVPRRLLLVGAACSIVPDFDVAGFRFGIRYGDLFGHRGLTHSLVFTTAIATTALVWSIWLAPRANRGLLWFYLFLATASHGLLDACTNGGLGVAFFSPFETTRYFFDWRPIAVSPIGARFFSERGLPVLASEFYWIWLPSIAFAAAAFAVRRLVSRGLSSKQPVVQ